MWRLSNVLLVRLATADENSPALPEIPIGSYDTGMRCVWDGSKTQRERMMEGCGFACPSPWGNWGQFKTWKAQEEQGLKPDGSWKEALELTHECGAPGHCCCKPTCDVPKLANEAIIGMNWSDKYMRNSLDRIKQFEVLKSSGFYHLKLFSPDGLKEIAEVYGTEADDPEVSMMMKTTAHAYVGFPNRLLSKLSTSVEDCKEMLIKDILPYKEIVKMLIVGNEPLLCVKTADWAKNGECGSLQVPAKLLPAMKNIYLAAQELGIDVPVSTAFNGGIMKMGQNPWTPCVADYKEFLKPILEPVWDFLRSQTPPAPFMVNIYSWFAAMAKHLSPTESCGFYEPYQRDEQGEIMYTVRPGTDELVPIPFVMPFDGNYNYLFNYDTQLDMQRVAMCKNGLFDIPLWVGETGWPSGSHEFATYANSLQYMQNIVKRGKGDLLAPPDVDTGRWSGVPHSVFLFEAFNEEYKFEIEHGNRFENEFGIFHESGMPKWVRSDGYIDLDLPLHKRNFTSATE